MKKSAAILTVCAVILFNAFAGASVVAYFNYSTFNIPGKGPYVETYISIFGNTLKYTKNVNGKFQAEVEVSMLFLQNDSIKASQKYVLSGPEIADTSAKSLVNFVDLKRIPLKQGLYKMELQIADKNTKQKPFLWNEEIMLAYPKDKIIFSDIELIESYTKSASANSLTKNGLDIVPYCSNFFPANLSKLGFYAEAYNIKENLGDSSKFVFNYYIETYETKMQLPKFNKVSAQKPNTVNILLAEFNIADLPSGNYNLVAEVHDRNNKLITLRKAFFQRLNPNAHYDTEEIAGLSTAGTFVAKMMSKDTLKDYIHSMRPIASESEKVFIDEQIKSVSLEVMQQYFYNFWVTRDKLNPENAWLIYHAQVLKVNKMYSTTSYKGYDTDRGRVYLQYGPPSNDPQVVNEPTAFPYEIWQYYRITQQNQTNRKFVFMNEELAGNNFKLIHSDARGEIYDSNWQMRLNKRTIQSNNMDMTKPGVNNYGNNVDENFNNPK